MDIFKSLPWRIQHPSELDNIPYFIPKNTPEIVSFFKPLEDQQIRSLNLRLINEKNETEKNSTPGFRPLPPYSLTKLTVNDHKKYLEVLQFSLSGDNSRIKPELKNSLTFCENLEPIVKEERTVYTNFVKDKWTTTGTVKCQNIRSEIQNYFMSRWQIRSKIFDRYPKYYNQLNMVPLFFKDDTQFEMKLTLNLQEMGMLPTVAIPKIKKRRYYMKIDNEPVMPLKLLPVSQDHLAEQMAQQCDANVVISTSGLKHIFDNHPPYNSQWNLPVRIKEYCSYIDGKEIKKKIIYIDKVLPKNKLNNVQKNYWVFKQLIKTKFTKNVCYSYPEEFPLQNDEEIVNMKIISEKNVPDALNETSSTSVNGLCANTENNPKENMFSDNETENDDNHSDDSFSELVIDMSENEEDSIKEGSADQNQKDELSSPSSSKRQKTPEQFDCRITRSMSKLSMSQTSSSPVISPRSFSASPLPTTNSQSPMQSPPIPIQSPPIPIQSPPVSMPTTSIPMQTTPASTPIKQNKYVSYRLWTLVCRENSLRSSSSKKVQFKPIKILIRSKIDACQNNKREPVILTPKLDYQLEYGAEVCTQGELCRQWISSYVWPCSTIFRVRMDPENLEYVHYDECNLMKIMNDANFLYKQNFNNKWSSLYSVLSELQCVPPGEYILSHTPRSGTFASLLVSSQNRSSNTVLNLDDLKEFTTVQEDSYAWMPLDCTVILPNNIVQNVVPGLFKGNDKPIVKKAQKRKRKKVQKKKKPKKQKTAV